MNVPRTGNCWQASMKKMIEMQNPDAFLVHGLPMGAGKIAQYGRYPHGWVELGDSCWESMIESWLPKGLYYAAGEIEFSVRYSLDEMHTMMAEKDTYGPWPQELLDRDVELDEIWSKIS